MHSFDGHFEVHLTVLNSEDTVPDFRDWCVQNQLKCVLIVLSRGVHPLQPMATWRRTDTQFLPVLSEAKQIAESASQAGFQAKRLKIETPLTNRGVPRSDGEVPDADTNRYFEHHLKLRRLVGTPVESLQTLCESHGAHLSRNAFAQMIDGYEHRFVTLRSYGVGSHTSKRSADSLLAALRTSGEQVIERESEYCIYDSNQNLDAGWLSRMAELSDPPKNKS